MADNAIDDLQFENLLRSFEQFSDECERMIAGQVSSQTLIASAEYELEQLKLVFAGAKLEPSVLASEPAGIAASASEAEPLVADKGQVTVAEPRTSLAA